MYNPNNRKKKSLFGFLGKLILVLFLAAVILYVLFDMGIIGNTSANRIRENVKKEISIEKMSVEHPDADEYYENNAVLLEKVNAKESPNIKSEAQAAQNMTERGFTEYPVSYEYSDSGEYKTETEVNETSEEKHPIYMTYYVTPNEEMWTIYEVNGCVMANPVTYNMQRKSGAPMLISESETIMSYDSKTNSFYETVPNESEADVKVVERIDSKTLDSLTVEMLGAQ